jgi:ribosome recycling factor
MNKQKAKINLNLYKDNQTIYSVFEEFNKRFENLLTHFKEDLDSFQVSRVNPKYIGNLFCDGDHSKQISKIANISIENRTFIITVHDKKNVNPIIKTIEQMRCLNASLGDQKNVIKVVIPDPTEERREHVIKEMKIKTEDYKAQIQNFRRDLLADLEKKKKAKVITEDDLKTGKNILESLKENALIDLEDLFSKQERDIRKAIK